MIKWFVNNNKIGFYNNGIEIGGRVYGIHSDVDIQKIKRRIAMQSVTDDEGNMPEDVDMEAEIAKINHTDVVFDMPTDEQLNRISCQSVYDNEDAAKLVNSVINNEVSQDEINAMILLELAELKVGVLNNE